MKKGLLFVLTLWAAGISGNAQTLKTAVLVVGNGNSALAAGIQSAVSGVKTIILTQADHFEISDPKLNLHSGIELEFLTRMRAAKKISDPSSVLVVEQKTANEVIKAWCDTAKNLTIIYRVNYVKLSRSGSGWAFKLSNGQTIKSQVLVHAGNNDLDAALNLPKTKAATSSAFDYKDNIYRTSIAAGYYLPDRPSSATYLTLSAILPEGQENLVLANAMGSSMLVGQAAGATAAYAAFFDTKTSLVKLKEIQGELLKYKLAIVPFADVPVKDPNWKAIQNIGIMGIIKAEVKPDKLLFWPDGPVTAQEIEQPLKELYYKAQIWFDDHKGSPLTLVNTLSLVCYVGNKSLINTSDEIKKKWKATYKFSGDFELTRVLSRREISAILADYLQPLEVNVDKTGRVMR